MPLSYGNTMAKLLNLLSHHPLPYLLSLSLSLALLQPICPLLLLRLSFSPPKSMADCYSTSTLSNAKAISTSLSNTSLQTTSLKYLQPLGSSVVYYLQDYQQQACIHLYGVGSEAMPHLHPGGSGPPIKSRCLMMLW